MEIFDYVLYRWILLSVSGGIMSQNYGGERVVIHTFVNLLVTVLRALLETPYWNDNFVTHNRGDIFNKSNTFYYY